MEISRAETRTVAGVDVGGTKVTFILWSGGSVTYRTVLPYAARSGPEFTDLILEGMGDLRQRATDAGTVIAATGIGCAGMADQKRGILLFSPNMPRRAGRGTGGHRRRSHRSSRISGERCQLRTLRRVGRRGRRGPSQRRDVRCWDRCRRSSHRGRASLRRAPRICRRGRARSNGRSGSGVRLWRPWMP